MRLDADHVRGLGGEPGQMEAGAAADVEDVGAGPGASAPDLGIDESVGIGRLVLQLVDSRELPDVGEGLAP